MTTETKSHLRPNPAGGWIVDVTVNGKRRQLKAATKAEAAARLALAIEQATPTSPWQPTSAPLIDAFSLYKMPMAPAVSKKSRTPF